MTDAYYRIKSQYSIIGHDSNKVEIRYGVWNPMSFYLYDKTNSGQLLPFLLALDGKKSVKEIVKNLNISRSKAEAVLDQLRGVDLIENKVSSAFDFYTNNFTPLLKVAEQREKIDKIFILGDFKCVGITNTLLKKISDEKNIKLIIENKNISEIFSIENESIFFNGLEKEKFLARFSSWKNSFVVVLMTSIDLVALHQINTIAYELKIHWIIGVIDGPTMMIGPTFIPSQGPCFGCFEARVGMNIRESVRYVDYKKKIFAGNPTRVSQKPLLEVLEHILCAHVVLEVTNYLLTENTYTIGKVLSMYLPTMEIAYNEVLPFSGCSVCGKNTVRDDYQLYFDIEEMIEINQNEN